MCVLFECVLYLWVRKLHMMTILSFRKNLLNAALQVCNSELRKTFHSPDINNNSDLSFYEYIYKIALSKKSILKSCVWVENEFDCDHFRNFFSEGGLCFTLNMLNGLSIYSNMCVFRHYSKYAFGRKMKP